ncbi:MAG: type IX secretion system membrane protein PorP/SprF [Cyclobacteriaceae bacterium]|nr:MAG: type IX secretion system membrane protein PorP/SprF [Cyclobacteriaceae bacterium]
MICLYRKSLFAVAFVFLISAQVKGQQDPLYNLYYYNQAMINPAYAGLYKDVTLNLISRKQWVGIEGSPLTNFFSFTSSVGKRFGLGAMVVDDRLGINTTQEGQLAFSFKVIAKGETTLSLGVQGGLINYRYDYSKLNLEYVDDEDIDFTRTQFSTSNVGTGIFFRTEKFYLGVSVPRILNVEINDGMAASSRYLRHYYVSGGFIINNTFNNLFRLKPSFLLRMVPDGQQALDVSLHALFLETIWAGVTVRNFNALGANGQFQVSQRLRVAYSFELPTNSLLSQNFGTHEISLLLAFSPLGTQQKVVRYF